MPRPEPSAREAATDYRERYEEITDTSLTVRPGARPTGTYALGSCLETPEIVAEIARIFKKASRSPAVLPQHCQFTALCSPGRRLGKSSMLVGHTHRKLRNPQGAGADLLDEVDVARSR
jgi:hypothetical protein